MRTGENFRPYLRPNVLALDLNAIIHPVAQQIMRETGREADIPSAVIERIKEIVAEVHPQNTLIVGIDGVAPVAKINQQRKRRYVNDLERRKAALEQGEELKSFDSNSISPGTDLMFTIDAALRKFLQERIDDPDEKIFPPNIVYSSHLKPGEGEHTIADLLNSISLPRVAIYGSDADLIMIYLPKIKRFDDILVLRENRRLAEGKPEGKTEERKGRRAEQRAERGRFPARPEFMIENTISLARLSKEIRSVFQTPYPEHDFITLLLLNGNDFLPRFTSLELPPLSLSLLTDAYTQFSREHKEGISGETGINWEMFARFLNSFSSQQELVLLRKWGINDDHEYPIILESEMQYRFRTESSEKYGLKAPERKFNLDRFKEWWYVFALETKLPEGFERDDPTDYVSREDINEMLDIYLQGINWVWTYYLRGQSLINQEWYYAYHYPPLMEDVAFRITEKLGKGGPLDWKIPTTLSLLPPVSVLEQLVMILPPGSAGIVPSFLQILFGERSPIIDVMPSDFRIDDRGKVASFDPKTKRYHNYQKIALLPFTSPARIRATIQWLRLPARVTQKYNPVTITFLTRKGDFIRKRISYRKRGDIGRERSVPSRSKSAPSGRRPFSRGRGGRGRGGGRGGPLRSFSQERGGRESQEQKGPSQEPPREQIPPERERSRVWKEKPSKESQ
jgi:5'-3' exonuclease